MDWKYKHFYHEAIYKALPASVLEAARAVMTDALGTIEDTRDGFVARGYSAWHSAIATFQVASAVEGAKLTVELRVQRSTIRGYMLVDIGGYYSGQIDKWFLKIAEKLGGTQEQALVSKTSHGLTVQRGCLAGCLVYLILGTSLVILAIPIDRAIFPRLGSNQGPFTYLASVVGLLIGITVFFYFAYPESSMSKFIRGRLQMSKDKDK
jgi:hypothetical protein